MFPYHHIAFNVGAENGLGSVRLLVQLGNSSPLLINGLPASVLGLKHLLEYISQPVVHLYATRLSVVAKALDSDVGGIASFRLENRITGNSVERGEGGTDTARACVVDDVVFFLREGAGHGEVDGDCIRGQGVSCKR